MIGKRHPPEEIAAKLAQADDMVANGKSQREVTRALGVSVMTYHRWRKMRRDQAPLDDGEAEIMPSPGPDRNKTRAIEKWDTNRLEDLQLENTRLRRLVTDLLLEKIKLEEEVQHRNEASLRWRR